MTILKNLNCDLSQFFTILKLWHTSKSQIVTILNYKTKIVLWQNWKPQTVAKVLKSNCDKTPKNQTAKKIKKKLNYSKKNIVPQKKQFVKKFWLGKRVSPQNLHYKVDSRDLSSHTFCGNALFPLLCNNPLAPWIQGSKHFKTLC